MKYLFIAGLFLSVAAIDSCNGQTAPETTPLATTKGVIVLWTRVTFGGLTYTASLRNTSSPEYATMTERVRTIFMAVFNSTGTTLHTVANSVFTPGSITVTVKLGVDEATTKSVNELLAEMENVILNGGLTKLEGLNPSSIQLEDNAQGNQSLVLQCPSPNEEACANYFDDVFASICPGNTELCDALNIDFDECTLVNPCGDFGFNCVNTPGSYACTCFDGFTAAPCKDINECLSEPCVNATCENTLGSSRCNCLFGYTRVDALSCKDVDECEAHTNICGDFGNCINTNGSHICNCNNGFYDKDGVCADILECDTKPCDVKADCEETVGSFTCKCKSGYAGTGIGNGTCADQDECNEDNGGNDCNTDLADCVNTEGGFSCKCKKDFEDKDPANPGSNCSELPCRARCHQNAACIVAENTCTCLKGFTGDGEENCTIQYTIQCFIPDINVHISIHKTQIH